MRKVDYYESINWTYLLGYGNVSRRIQDASSGQLVIWQSLFIDLGPVTAAARRWRPDEWRCAAAVTAWRVTMRLLQDSETSPLNPNT